MSVVGCAGDPRGAAGAHGRASELGRIARRIERTWRARNDTSYDPYDGLEARRVPVALRRHRLTRLALVQWHKRLPVNTRRLFGIAPSRNAYAVGQLVSASVKLAAAEVEDGGRSDAAIGERLRWLESVRVRGGWTYPFEVQTKTSHYVATSPNVISTVFAGTAFADAAEMSSDGHALDVAVEAGEFITRELSRTGASGGYFAYLPGEDVLIHNASVLAARLLVRVGVLSGNERMVERGVEAVATTVRAVGSDGSLAYGEGARLGWVDGHHTGFVIDALHGVRVLRPGAVPAESLASMVDFYRARLFGADGCPFQAPDRRYPIDAIAGAQGIQTFAALGPEHHELALRIARFMLEHMRMRSGSFVYHRQRFHSKRVPYLRWADAPMCDALATLARALRKGSQ